ncbi:translation initiation factor IF-1 [Candidatus Shikimatogenerans silvanidophilus]|uniref:translation initiation factor IF-1 n=1 Tax=Candidatus Shikimatogenerans silvanidophilus TaxID=2782547 RepID=UPI001BAA7145|nr:translation initiation factor IF-1 [Candidatus Shikimatogenerans silvanidophilus]
MPKEKSLEADGVIIEQLPNAVFRVKLDNGYLIKAYIGGKMKLNYIKLLKGDRVKLEMSHYDLTIARIIYRY